jgi:hypothetical protein
MLKLLGGKLIEKTLRDENPQCFFEKVLDKSPRLWYIIVTGGGTPHSGSRGGGFFYLGDAGEVARAVAKEKQKVTKERH